MEDAKDCPDFAPLMRKHLIDCGVKCENPASTTAPNATPGITGLNAAIKEAVPVESKFIHLITTAIDVLIGITKFKKKGYSITGLITQEDKVFKLRVVVMQVRDLQFKDSKIFTGFN